MTTASITDRAEVNMGKTLMYKGRPLMRKDNIIYYGSMQDPYIIFIQISETKKVGDLDVA